MCVYEWSLIPEMFDGEEGGDSLQYENVCPHQGQAVSLWLPAHVGMLSPKENSTGLDSSPSYSDKKENKIFLIYKEIHMG